MSGKVVGWAFGKARELDLSPTQRFILVAYADNASEGQGKCWPDKEEIVEKTGYSQATVYRAIRELEAHELIDFTTDAKGRPCVFLSVPWFSQSEKSDSHPEKKDSQGEKSTNKGTVTEPSQARKKKIKVDGKAVTDDELALADHILESFNRRAGTGLTLEAHLVPLVMRIRQRPTLTPAQHDKIIAAVFDGEHWWTDPPGPRIIYGNPAQFEQSIELARKAHNRSANTVDVRAQHKAIRKAQGLE